MKLTRLKPGHIGSNCYILIDGAEAAVIDPGSATLEIMKVIDAAGAKLTKILLTHCHFDHMLGIEKLKKAAPEAEVMVHADDAELMPDGHKNAFYVFFKRERSFGAPDKLLIEGDIITVGSSKLRLIHTPGHTNGSSCYMCGNVIFSGDTVFADGYGRCDLYAGDLQKLNSSINKLAHISAKNPKLIIYPGHGESESLIRALNHIYGR